MIQNQFKKQQENVQQRNKIQQLREKRQKEEEEAKSDKASVREHVDRQEGQTSASEEETNDNKPFNYDEVDYDKLI